MKKVMISAPFGVGNIVAGFDVLGMVLNEPAEYIEVERREDGNIAICHIDRYGLPTEPDKNVAGVALKALKAAYPEAVGFSVTIEKLIRPGSGLGSSAASAAGVVVAANHLLGNYFTKEQLVHFAMVGEQLASGGLHADNIAPAIYGGISLVHSIEPLDVISLPIPEVFVTVVHPHVVVKTSEARAILPKQVSMHTAIEQLSHLGAMVAALYTGDLQLIRRSLVDLLAEPYRNVLIPCYSEVKQRSMNAGALGGGISGSGPSIFMLSEDEPTARKVEQEMHQVYRAAGMEHKTYVTTINPNGVKIISQE